jgi:hypothetical protein
MSTADPRRQYTLRGVPADVDRALRRQAQAEGRSLNEVAIDALRRGAGVPEPAAYDDLDALIGGWQEDATVEQAMARQDEVDPELWL